MGYGSSTAAPPALRPVAPRPSGPSRWYRVTRKKPVAGSAKAVGQLLPSLARHPTKRPPLGLQLLDLLNHLESLGLRIDSGPHGVAGQRLFELHR